MGQFVIEQRQPGRPDDPAVGWEAVATVDAADAPTAMRTYCNHMQWWSVGVEHHRATVPGVGYFRAVPGQEELLETWVVQRQREPGPADRHLVWESVGSVSASDVGMAIRVYCEHHQWGNVAIRGDVFKPYGLGLFRVVPAAAAKDVDVTPAP